MEYLKNFVDILFNVLFLAIMARVLLSWTKWGPENRFVKIIHEVTEPILFPIRKFIPKMGMFDISPIIAVLLLEVIQQLIGKMIN